MTPDGLLIECPPDHQAARRLLVGPKNHLGQAAAWARSVTARRADVSAVSLDLDTAGAGAPADVVTSYLTQTFTHLLLETGKPMITRTASGDARALRGAGLHVGLVIHDTELPGNEGETDRLGFDPYHTLSTKRRARLDRRAKVTRTIRQRFAGPLFVSAAGLAAALPEASWLPFSIGPGEGEAPRPLLAGSRPTVAFAAGDASPAASWIAPVLSDLHAAGAIAYDSSAGLTPDRARLLVENADVVIDEAGPDGYGMHAVTALAAGRIVLGVLADCVGEQVRHATGRDLPITAITPTTLPQVLSTLADRPAERLTQAAQGPDFVESVHSGQASVRALSEFLDRPPRVLSRNPAKRRRADPRASVASPRVRTGRPRPHALYVAWGFPPCRGGGVYRALATANALDRVGFDVTVLTAEREVFARYTGADTSLEALVAPGVTVHRIAFEWPIFETEISRWPRERAKDPQGWLARRRQLDQEDFPEISYGPWKARLLTAADQIAARRQVDLTIGTANPNVDLVVGPHLLASRGVPYVMDYRDAWRLDVFSGDELDLDPRVRELEAAYVADAAEMWFVNDPIRDWHAAEYPGAAEKMFTVMNGYDEDLAPAPRDGGPEPGTALRFGYIGTISSKVPVAEFIAGWRKARVDDELLRRSSADLWGYLGFFATENRALKTLVANASDDDVFFRGRIDKTDVAAAYESFDVLLLILGSGLYVTSGKVFEYMAAALPIVSVHDPGNAASSVLDGYPLWFPAEDLSDSAIAAALSAAAAAASRVDPAARQACVEFAAAFERDRQLLPRIEQLYARCLEAR